jgi:hypothetical protein
MKEEITKRAALIAEALVGTDGKDSVDVLGEGLAIALKSGKCTHAPIVPIWYIAKLVSETNGQKGVVSIKKDGNVSFTIQAGKEKKMSI